MLAEPKYEMRDDVSRTIIKNPQPAANLIHSFHQASPPRLQKARCCLDRASSSREEMGRKHTKNARSTQTHFGVTWVPWAVDRFREQGLLAPSLTHS